MYMVDVCWREECRFVECKNRTRNNGEKIKQGAIAIPFGGIKHLQSQQEKSKGQMRSVKSRVCFGCRNNVTSRWVESGGWNLNVAAETLAKLARKCSQLKVQTKITKGKNKKNQVTINTSEMIKK